MINPTPRARHRPSTYQRLAECLDTALDRLGDVRATGPQLINLSLVYADVEKANEILARLAPEEQEARQ